MARWIAAILSAAGVAYFCAVPTAAAGGQRTVTLPPGGPYRLDAVHLEEQLGAFDAVAVTLPPDSRRAVLFLDGEPLPAGKHLTRTQLAQVSAFVRAGVPVTVGIFPFAAQTDPEPSVLRIRCINPDFSGQDNNTSTQILKEAVHID